jgi:ABC-2 type transport system ATP-binding protein
MPTEIVRIDGVSKRFVLHKDKSVKERLVNFRSSRAHREDFWALTDVDLTVHSGATLGLVGHNGSGKSTLLKIIGGIIQPSSGTVQRRGRLAALLELGAGFHPDLTGRENVYLNAAILGLTQSETNRHFDEIVAFSGIEEFIDTQVKFYSSGMFVRLAFAVAVHVDPDLLLVDEVLAVGDEPFQRKCMDKIAQFQREGRTIIVVSHSAQQIGELCDRVVVLEHGRVAFDGGPREGLQVLRQSFETEEEEASAGVVDGPGPRITSVRVTGDERDGAGRFTAGSDLKIEVRYRQQAAPVGWIAGIDIENALGQDVYRVNTQGLGTPLPTEAGDYRLVIDLPRNAFGGGAYRVHASCVTAGGDPLDRRAEPATFEIEDDLRGAGLFQFAARGVNEKI